MKKRPFFDNAKLIILLSVFFIGLCFLIQIYVVYQYFLLTEDFLKRETDIVLDEAFRIDTNRRFYILKESRVELHPFKQKIDNEVEEFDDYNLDEMGVADKYDVFSAMSLAIHIHVSETHPLNLQVLDSIIAPMLQEKDIYSKYYIQIVEKVTNRVLQSTGNNIPDSFFLIHSKELPLNFEKTEYLQLFLVNPYGDIFRRMGLMLACSFVFSLFAVYGLWKLFDIYSKQKQLVAAKNDFFNQISHELRRPVSHVSMALERLSAPMLLENPKNEKFLSIAINSTTNMSEKIDMIMALSLAETFALKLNETEFDLCEIITELEKHFIASTNKKFKIETVFETMPFHIKADKGHIRQCISNLLDNAIKYSEKKVDVVVSVRREERYALISVKDNGIGIPEDKLPIVFDKYARVSDKKDTSGFGIGLNYVKEIAELHGGNVSVASKIGEGSTFTMKLKK